MREVVLGPLFKLFEAILELLVPLVMADMIDTGVRNGDAAYAVRGGLLMLGLAALGAAAGLTCQYFAAVAAGNFGSKLRRQLFSHIMRLGPAEAGAYGAGALVTRLTNDAVQVQTGVNMFIRLATRAPFITVGSIVMAFLIDFRAGLVFLAAAVLISAILFVIMRRTLPGYRKIQRQQDELSRISGESLDGVRVIRAFARERDEQAAFGEAGGTLSKYLVRVGRINAALNPLTTVVANLAIVAVVWVGGRLVFSGGLQTGEIIALLNYMNQILLTLIVSANLIVIFTRAITSAARIERVLETEPSVTDGAGAKAPMDRDAVVFESVTFAYHAGRAPALQAIGFAIGPGETLGIIGGTGSGKSTVARLLLRFYDVNSGSINIFGTGVTEYTLQQLRELFALVPQKAVLLKGTVRSNLQMANPDATDEQMWEALEIAQAKAFVGEKQKGLYHPIDENGTNLSGGQRQRLTIARALLRQPAVLLLDDATSALDYATEARLKEGLQALKARRAAGGRPLTLVMISQRVSTVRTADKILVLDDGRMAGFGAHGELLQKSDVYRQICASQGVGQEKEDN